MRSQLLLALVILIAFAGRICAQETVASPTPAAGKEEEKESESPSPDGKFAFLTDYAGDLHTIDLIDAKSKKVVLRVGEEDSEMVHYSVLWAPDSKRFALMTRYGHPIQGIDVFFRSGDRFHKIKLPKLPEAKIPERLKRGKSFPHVAGLDWTTAEAWKKDGSLVVSIVTMIDGGDGGSITATRTVVLGFDRAGKATILKSTIKFETEAD